MSAPSKAERLEAAMKERDALDAKYQAERAALRARIRAIEAEP